MSQEEKQKISIIQLLDKQEKEEVFKKLLESLSKDQLDNITFPENIPEFLKKSKPYSYFIKSNEVFIGYIGVIRQIHKIFKEEGYFITIFISPNYTKKGVGKKAVELFLQKNLKKIKQIYGSTWKDNVAMNKIFISTGGILIKQSKYVNLYIYKM